MVASSDHAWRVARVKAENDLIRWIEDDLCPALGNWKLIKLAPINTQANSVEMVSLWEEKDCEVHLLRMDIALFHTHRLALEHLYQLPNEMVHPVFAENGGPLPLLGDARLVICLDMTGTPVRSYFTRGNVMVAVMSSTNGELDITEIANTVDRLLQRDSVPDTCREEDPAQ